MPKQSITLSDKLILQFRSLENTRAKIDVLRLKGALSQTAKDRMYEALFLNAHVLLESFLEDLFFGLLVSGGLRSARRDVVPRITINSQKIARELVVGLKKNYVDWMPFDHTLDLAKLYFRGGRPFSDLTAADKNLLLKCNKIRNAVAHKSAFSMKKFEQHVIDGSSLPPNERKPTGYLQGVFRITPRQTRFSNLLAQLSKVSRTLAR